MLDNFYENIGDKIKNWAKWIFILEAIGAIITGFVLICNGFFLAGFLTLFLGPFVAWVGSWILYAFGELVEKTSNNESNTRQILEKLNKEITHNTEEYKHEENPTANESTTSNSNEIPPENKEVWEDTATFLITENNTIICSLCKCEQPNNRKVCWHCGVKFKEQATVSDAPYWCGKCGHDGPYDGNCPICGSSLKKYNVSDTAE